MKQKLIDIHSSLSYLRKYIVKLSIERRNSKLAYDKYLEAKELNEELNILVQQINQLGKNSFSSADWLELSSLAQVIPPIYQEICGLVTYRPPKEDRMASTFDFKTAIALMPVMVNGQDEVTNRLIEGISLYSSTLQSTLHKDLINFVLKTRLSSSAKLRLKSTYATVESLIKDMKTHLLQKKSAVALQTQLLNTRQGNKSIESFGNELEEVFVNLTIAQACGDDTHYNILRPLNEKLAVKRFSDGLSNHRLSTIIASRQFQSLPEAIQAAVDETTLIPHQSEMMNFQQSRRGYRGRGGNRGNQHRGRGSNSNHQSGKPNRNQNRNFFRQNNQQTQNNTDFGNQTNTRNHHHGNGSQQRGSRGSYRGNYRGNQRYVSQVHNVDIEETNNPNRNISDSQTQNQFFRDQQ